MKLPALFLTAAVALSATASAAPTQISYRTFHYVCDGGKKISVAYVKYGQDGPTFAVLNWQGQQYGLAQAVSASGARYASLSGPTVSGGGLEWWEHQGKATLKTFVGTDTANTRTLLMNCKTGR